MARGKTAAGSMIIKFVVLSEEGLACGAGQPALLVPFELLLSKHALATRIIGTCMIIANDGFW